MRRLAFPKAVEFAIHLLFLIAIGYKTGNGSAGDPAGNRACRNSPHGHWLSPSEAVRKHATAIPPPAHATAQAHASRTSRRCRLVPDLPGNIHAGYAPLAIAPLAPLWNIPVHLPLPPRCGVGTGV